MRLSVCAGMRHDVAFVAAFGGVFAVHAHNRIRTNLGLAYVTRQVVAPGVA